MNAKMIRDCTYPALGATTAIVLAGIGLSAMTSQAAQSRLTVSAAYRAEADIDGGLGDFNENRFSVSGAHTMNMSERLQLEPILSYRYSSYDFSRNDLWDEVHQPRATVLARYGLNEHWTLFAGPSIGLSAESDADFGDAVTYGAALGATYSVNKNLTLGGGFTVSTEIEEDVRVRPVAIVRWLLNDEWEVEAGYTEVAAQGGPGAEVRYQLTSQWSLGAGFQYQEKRFRLSEDGPVRDGVGEDRAYPIYARVAWSVCPNATLELVGGVALGGELTVENRDDHEVREENYDPAPLVGLRANVTF